MPDTVLDSDKIYSIITKLKNKGASQADIIAIGSSDVCVEVRQGTNESIETSDSYALGIRAFIGKQQAVVSSTDMRDSTIDKLVDKAVIMAKNSPEDPHSSIANANLLCKKQPDLDIYDEKAPSIEQLSQEAIKTEDAALSHKGITNSEGASASSSKNEIVLATSSGFCEHYKSSSFSLSVSVLAGKGLNKERDYEYSCARHFGDVDSAQNIGNNAAKRTLKRLGARKISTTKVPVIMEPRVSRSLMTNFANAVNGSAVARGTSFLWKSKDTQIFRPDIEISNDPHIKRGLASKPFDAEGVANEKINLVEDGILCNWLLDLRSASKLGLKTNGSASRSLNSSPTPSSSNLYMKNGSISVHDMIKDLKSGFLVCETFGMGINPVTGDYSQGASGFWIEEGAIAYPVNEVTIAGTLQEMFRSLIPANDLEFKYQTNCPTVLIENMTLAGS